MNDYFKYSGQFWGTGPSPFVIGLAIAIGIYLIRWRIVWLCLVLRTKFWWKPQVGDEVITGGILPARQRISRIISPTNFECTNAPHRNFKGPHSTSNFWNKKNVLFVKRGEF